MSDKEFGIPEQKKFPLDTRAHVISAIRFFNYAEPQYRKELASRIIQKIHEYNITGLTPSNQNAFYNYYHPKTIVHSEGGNMSEYCAVDKSAYIEHYGILGQKWGRRRYQNSDGSLTSAGKTRYGKLQDRVKSTGESRDKQSWKTINRPTSKNVDKLEKRSKEHANAVIDKQAFDYSFRGDKSPNAARGNAAHSARRGLAISGIAGPLGPAIYGLAKSKNVAAYADVISTYKNSDFSAVKQYVDSMLYSGSYRRDYDGIGSINKNARTGTVNVNKSIERMRNQRGLE